jgi:surface polysaccharide O-acyltransferase-like enzyme
LIPFLVWTAIYLIWKKILFQPDLGLAEAFIRAAGNKVHFHLWFFYALTGIYLATPILRIFVRQAQSRDLIYFILLWFFFASLMPFLEGLIYLLWHADFHLKIPVNIAEGLVGYFVLGYYFRTLGQKTSQQQFMIWVWLAWGGSLAVCLAGSYFLNLRLGHYDGLFYENTAPNVAIYVASFFLIAKSFAEPLAQLSEKKQKIILLFSKASFGIYLVHPMIMEAVEKGRWGFKFGPTMHPQAMMIIVTTTVVYLLSLGVVLMLQRVPYLRRIV